MDNDEDYPNYNMATYTDLEGDWSMLNQEIHEWTATGKFLSSLSQNNPMKSFNDRSQC